jgi:GT2 family glycosyltransferase
LQLSIIIVNYKSPGLILDALATVYRETRNISFEVLVVDNASGDDSRDIIQSVYPDVRWIDMGYNAGFARANNAGIRASGADAVLLLNPDTLILKEAISAAYIRLRASSYVACGVQMLNLDRSPQVSGSYFIKGGLNHLLPLPYWGSLLRKIGYSARIKAPSIWESKSVEEVDWISGAFLMVKRSAIDQAGLMDEDFFLYGEEIEWCSRLGKVGKLCIFGDEHIIHLQGETSGEKGYKGLFTRKDYQVMVSNHLRIRKQFGVGWFLFLLLNYTFAIPVYFVGSFLHRLFTGRNPFGEWLQGVRFAWNVWGIWVLAPKIIRGKPYFYKML